MKKLVIHAFAGLLIVLLVGFLLLMVWLIPMSFRGELHKPQPVPASQEDRLP